eukprot:UN24378
MEDHNGNIWGLLERLFDFRAWALMYYWLWDYCLQSTWVQNIIGPHRSNLMFEDAERTFAAANEIYYERPMHYYTESKRFFALIVPKENIQKDLPIRVVIRGSFNFLDWNADVSLCDDEQQSKINIKFRDIYKRYCLSTDKFASHEYEYVDSKPPVGRHSGIFLDAIEIVELIDEKVEIDVKERNLNFEVTGHSLGGGLSIYVHYLLKQKYSSSKIETFAFAPPPALDLESAKDLSDKNLHCFCFYNDVVPRLCGYALQEQIRYFIDGCMKGDLMKLLFTRHRT